MLLVLCEALAFTKSSVDLQLRMRILPSCRHQDRSSKCRCGLHALDMVTAEQDDSEMLRLTSKFLRWMIVRHSRPRLPPINRQRTIGQQTSQSFGCAHIPMGNRTVQIVQIKEPT